MLSALSEIQRDKIAIRGEFGVGPLIASLTGANWVKEANSYHFPKTPLIAQGILNSPLEFPADQREQLTKIAIRWLDEEAVGIMRVMDGLAQPAVRRIDSWNHQKQGYHFGRHMDGLMLAMDMGTGKTKVAIDISQNNHHKSHLISCPKSVVGVWPREFARHAVGDYDFATLDLGDTKKNLKAAEKCARIARCKGKPFVIIVNHESVWRTVLGEWILDQDWDCSILDESHRAKDPGGVLGIYISKLASISDQRMCLTGTPMPHSPLDCFSQYRFLEPGLFGINAHKFRQGFAVFEEKTVYNNLDERYDKAKALLAEYEMKEKKPPKSLTDKLAKLELELMPYKNEKADVHKGGRSINRIVDIQNERELNETYQRIAFRVKIDDVMDLPPMTFTTLPLKMDAKSYDSYADLEEHFFALVDEGEVTVSNALTRLIRCRQMASGYIVDDDEIMRDMSTHKLEALKDILEGIDEPIIVFCNFTWEVERCLEIAVAQGLRTGEITGRRHDLTPTSEMPDDIDFMAVNIKSGGTGIDLTRAALAVDFSPTFSLGDYDQSRARIRRPGQTRPTRIIQFSTVGTIEPVVYQALIKRRKAINSVLEMRSNANE
jgi:SNF2 family DNA or RNA helicase